MRTNHFLVNVLLAGVFALSVSGCSSAYVNTSTLTSAAEYPAVIQKAKKKHQPFILHSGINTYSVMALQLDNAKQNMEVQLGKVDSLQVVRVEQTNSGATSSNRGNTKGEIHFYMKDSTSYLLGEPYTIPLEKVARIDRVGKN